MKKMIDRYYLGQHNEVVGNFYQLINCLNKGVFKDDEMRNTLNEMLRVFEENNVMKEEDRGWDALVAPKLPDLPDLPKVKMFWELQAEQ
jgi:hypothetical protein